MHAALEGRLVRDDGDVGTRLEGDAPGVAAAYVEVVEIREGAQRGDGLLHTLAPPLVTDAFARRVAELLVEGLALAEAHVRDLEMWEQLAVEIEPSAEAGPERDDRLEPAAPYRAQALHVGIVQHAGGFVQPLGQDRGEVEALPTVIAEIRRAQHDAIPHGARE